MKNKRLYFPIFIIFIMTVSGCFKDDVEVDLKKISELGPIELTAPIVNVSLKAKDLLERMSDSISDYIQIEDDGLICMKYKDSIHTEWDQVVALEKVNFNYLYSPIDFLKSTMASISAEERILVNSSPDQRLDEMIIQSSNLSLAVEFPSGLSGLVNVTFPELTLNNQELVLVYDASLPTTTQDTNLAGYTLNFNHGQDSSYFTMIISSDNITGMTAFTGNVSANLSLSGLVPEVVFGFFGQDTVMNQDKTFDFTFYEDLDIEGMIEFYDIRMLVEFDNYFGLPYVGILDNAVVSNASSGETLGINFLSDNTLSVEPATYSDQVTPKFNSFLIDRTNSNIIDAVNMSPNKLDYKLIVQANPDDVNATNFVTQNNYIAGNISMIIPMWLRTAAYTRTDSILNFTTFPDLKDEDIQYFEKGTIALWFSNSFPFEIEAQLYFVDENFIVVDSLLNSNDKFLETGLLNEQDIVTTPGETFTQITLNKEQVEKYKNENVSAIIFSTKTSTANDGADFVKLIDTYGIDFKLAVDIEGTANTKK